MKKSVRQKGFSLIELLVAISILGALSALLLVNFQQARSRARDARRKEDLYSLKQALRLYYNDYQSYPPSSNGKINDGCASLPCAWGALFGTAASPYMKALPIDPLSPNQDYYYELVNSDNFNLYACLENTSDPDADAADGGTNDKCTSTGFVSYTIN